MGHNSGIWFYGLAGSGKTYASRAVTEVVESSIVIDGDDVRKFISTDLGYSAAERSIQLRRVLGIARLAILNRCFPVISTVTMSQDIYRDCIAENIGVVLIERPMEIVQNLRSIYRSGRDVVGVDIALEKIDTRSIFNDGSERFVKSVIEYVTK